MQVLLFAFLGCVLVIGCASPLPKKPSPYRHTITAPALGAYEQEPL